uniref:Uncharacterized protein n=1 Tax=Aegilops tauschii subsp. strangulata TaxID=200361 RepID=A0A453R4S3_AEGTS
MCYMNTSLLFVYTVESNCLTSECLHDHSLRLSMKINVSNVQFYQCVLKIKIHLVSTFARSTVLHMPMFSFTNVQF